LGKRVGAFEILACRVKTDFKEIGCDAADWIYLTIVGGSILNVAHHVLFII